MNLKFNREGMILRVDSKHIVSDYSNPGFANPQLLEDHLAKIGHWCFENHCGRRTSYDMFQFRNEQQMAAFLLKWT